MLNQSNAKAIELAHQKGMAVIVRGGLGTGLLTPKVAPFLNDPDLPYRNQIKALLNLTHGSYQQLMALELAFLYSNPNISSVIIGAANPTELEEDVQLLNTFNNPELVQQAATLMQKYPSGPFTDSVDAYFAKKLNNQQSVAQN
ncbi:MAG: aldo/keto reductase [Gammaproteobacteria bacterium]|nr:aldo/keto reductase [Gammaproteobacteria bacterium]